MKDWQTGREVDAGRFEQAQAWQQDDREHADDSLPIADDGHSPCGDDNCKRLLCVLDRVVADQKMHQRVLDEVNRERDREWWAS